MKRHRPAVCTERSEKKMRNVDCGTRNDGHGKQKSKVENRSAPIPSIVQSEAHSAIRDPKSAFSIRSNHLRSVECSPEFVTVLLRNSRPSLSEGLRWSWNWLQDAISKSER